MIGAILARFRLPLLASLAAMALLAGAYQTGVNAERSRGAAAALRVEIETMRADQRLAELARASARSKAAALEAETRKQEEEIDALRAQLDTLPEARRQRATGADIDQFHWGP